MRSIFQHLPRTAEEHLTSPISLLIAHYLAPHDPEIVYHLVIAFFCHNGDRRFIQFGGVMPEADFNEMLARFRELHCASLASYRSFDLNMFLKTLKLYRARPVPPRASSTVVDTKPSINFYPGRRHAGQWIVICGRKSCVNGGVHFLLIHISQPLSPQVSRAIAHARSFHHITNSHYPLLFPSASYLKLSYSRPSSELMTCLSGSV